MKVFEALEAKELPCCGSCVKLCQRLLDIRFTDKTTGWFLNYLVINNVFKLKLGFFYRNMSCLSYQVRKQSVSATLMSVLDYGDIVYMNASVSSLGMLDAVYHGALRFIITDIKFSTHRTRW